MRNPRPLHRVAALPRSHVNQRTSMVFPLVTDENFYVRRGKRWLDCFVALITVTIAAPLLLLAAISVRLESPGQALFEQDRIGRLGRRFRMLKLRSMYVDAPKPFIEVVGRSQSVTRVGSWLRRTKIDELPQLWNVLTGDMSLVGPRPLVPAVAATLDEVGAKRMLVRPGLTGLAQVNGGIYLPWPQRWIWDAHYAENVSLPNDLRIIGKTVLVLVFGEKRFTRTRFAPIQSADATQTQSRT